MSVDSEKVVSPLTERWWFVGLILGCAMAVSMTLINVFINGRALLSALSGTWIWLLVGLLIWGPLLSRQLRRQRIKQAEARQKDFEDVFK